MQELEQTLQKIREKSLESSSADAHRNHFKTVLRLFQLDVAMGYATTSQVELLQEAFNDLVISCYVFRFDKADGQGCNHGIYMKLAKAAPRSMCDKAALHIVKALLEQSADFKLEMRRAVPVMHKNMSVFDYLQTMYKTPKNLLLKFSNQVDALSADKSTNIVNHEAVSELAKRAKAYTKQILDNIVQFPALYPTTELFKVLNFSPKGYYKYMRETTFNRMLDRICSDAYDFALQSNELAKEEVQQLMDPFTRKSLITKLIDDKTIKQIQELLKSQYEETCVHPTTTINIGKTDGAYKTVFDVMLFDPKFLMPFLMCCRWFAKVCLSDTTTISNNNANLLLYGQAGAGKSLILSVISSNIPTYKYLTSGRFQNPDVLSSSVILIDEFDTTQLVSNTYKALLDIKSSVKTDFKNLHPENISRHVPCIISTNDDIHENLREIPQKRSQFTQHSVDAALRRLYIIPFKMGQYNKLHGNINQKNPRYSMYAKYNDQFNREEDIVDKLFNFMVGFSLLQQDVDADLKKDSDIQSYVKNLLQSFQLTLFGRFYIENSGAVNDLLRETERLSMQTQINDTELHVGIAMNAGKLEQMVRHYIVENTLLHDSEMADTTIPWQLKIYKAFDKGIQENKGQVDVYKAISQAMRQFTDDEQYMPYTFDEEIEVNLGEKRSFSQIMGVDCEFEQVDQQLSQSNS